jgi:hypothetical protein
MTEKRKFLFRCESCQMIVSVEFDDPEEIKKIQEDQMVLECSCGDHCRTLRD